MLRLTDVKEVFPEKENYELKNFTLAELKKLNYGSWFNKKYSERAEEDYNNLSILTLAEALELVDPINTGVGLFLELKSPYLYKGIEKKITELLEEKKIFEAESERPHILFLSFSPTSLRRLKEMRPDSPRILLTKRNFVPPKRWRGWLNITEEVADGIGPKGHVSFPWYIGQAHKRGLFVFPYVVNRSWQLKLLSWFSADGYITDRPRLLTDFYNRTKEIGESLNELGGEILDDEQDNPASEDSDKKNND